MTMKQELHNAALVFLLGTKITLILCYAEILLFFEISDFLNRNYDTIQAYIMLKGAGFSGN